LKLSLSLCKSIRRVVGYFNFPEWFVNAVENALIMTFPICFAKPLDNIPSRAKATSLLAFQPMSAIFKLLDETQQNKGYGLASNAAVRTLSRRLENFYAQLLNSIGGGAMHRPHIFQVLNLRGTLYAGFLHPQAQFA
jgi:hypothetical protein